MSRFLFVPFLLTLCVFSGCSCSPQDGLLGRISMYRAEEAYVKGHSLRIKKDVPYEERLEYYRQACNDFYRAYEYKPSLFTYNRIGMAVDACFRVKALDREKVLSQFEEQYAQDHPDEVKYGDAGPFMNLEG